MKTENNKFLSLVENAMQEPGRSHMRPVIEKELLHYDILFALNNTGLLDNLIFQGGTALRLCYGSPRFSEDLDFAAGYDFKIENLATMKHCLESYLSKHYGLEVSVKEPTKLSEELENQNIKVSKWQIKIVTHPERKDIPKQMIKIEVANVPTYTREPKKLVHNYNFLPDGYNDSIVLVESLDEIFADKIVSFVNCQNPNAPDHLRYRDIWDLHWLEQQGAIMRMELIMKKIQDYKIDDYTQKLDEMITRLPSIIHGKTFKDQMARFLPMGVQERTLLNKNYLYLLLENIQTLLKMLGFIWEEKNGYIYCTNVLRTLTQANCESLLNWMSKLKDKYGLVVSYGKKPQELVVSPSNESLAKELCMDPAYRLLLPKGYIVDHSFAQKQWYLKFGNE